MATYKLESHLNALCQEHPQYKDLQATWILNKRACADTLKGVLLRYPHFSMHDDSHADAVIAKMEMVLGERIACLSPTDVWLLLHTAYAHDLGMVVLWEEITKLWSQPEFQNYLDMLNSSLDSELREAAQFVKTVDSVTDIPFWPLKAYRYVNLINAAYFRSWHAEIAQKYIQTPEMDPGLDFGHSGLIQPRIIKLLGEICELHMESSEKILTLDYQTNGFQSDYAHPRFIAVLLRLGDLLDVDNGRFNTAGELSIGGLPKSSAAHKEKHEATTHLLVTPKKIEFRSNCPNQQSYLEARNFINQLESELDFFTKYWPEIVPQGFNGYAPRLQKKELLLCGTPDIEGVADLRFEISQEKAFQIIEGSNIYKDKFIFIRELIQNAADASKLQMWEDLVSGTYQAWLKSGKELAELQPYDISEDIYQNYPIDIKLSTRENAVTKIEISDRGTGISIEAFKRMCKVGISNSGSKKIQQSIQSMPDWLKPTAGFGVGLQSIFLLAESFEIDTNTGKETFHATVQSNRAGGYLQLQRTELSRSRGTTIRLCFRMPEQFQYSMMGETQAYLGMYFDPISPLNHLGEVRVIEAIRNNCGATMFPVSTSCSEEHVEPLNLLSKFPLCGAEIEMWKYYKGRYWMDVQNFSEGIRIWDTKTASYGEIRFVRRTFSNFCVRFKGNDVTKDTPHFRLDGISSIVDVYGLSTKETITLDRSALTQEGFKIISQSWSDMFSACIDCLLSELLAKPTLWEEAIKGQGNFSIYTIWLHCDPVLRAKIPLKLLGEINDCAVVLSYEDGSFKKDNSPVRNLIPITESTLFANTGKFDTHIGTESIDYGEMCTILNCAEVLDAQIIVVDDVLLKSTATMYLKTLQLPVEGERLWLHSVSDQQTLVHADEKTIVSILKGLSEYIPGMDYYYYYESKKAMRYAIPALEKYGDLAVDGVPYGLAKPHGHYRCCYVIAPFTREEAEKRREISLKAFCELVLASPTFTRLVDFIMKHSIRKAQISKEQIIGQYKSLIQDYYSAF